MNLSPKPNVIISHRDNIPPAQMDDLDKMIDHAFFAEWGPTPAEEAAMEWDSPEIHFVAYIEGQPVSHVGLLRRTVRVGAVEVVVGGIGGVSTHPDFLRRGYTHMLMQAAREYMQQDGGFAFGMLFCHVRSITLYEALGYFTLDVPLWMTQHGERKLYNSPKMVLLLTAMPWPEGEIDIQGFPW